MSPKMGYFGLGEEGYDRIYSDRKLFSRILKLFKPYRRSMTIIITFICLSSITYGLTPYIMSLIIKQLEIQSDPLILMGDLNAAPWSYITHQLSAKAGVRHAALGYGIWPTWRLGTILLGTPIDSILVSPRWIVKDYKIGEDVGSDHYPVMADLVLM